MEYIEHKAVWFPSAVRIAGLRLRPMTLGQLRLLEACNSPFVTGGQADADDCAIALWMLSTPWRRARRVMARPGLLACRLRLLAWRCGLDRRRGVAVEVASFVARCLWMPDIYEKAAPAPDSSSFGLATGLAVWLALRARRIGAGALCHLRRGAWDCVWDIPVDAVMACCVVAGEMEGQEYQSRREVESLAERELDANTNAGDDEPGVEQHLDDFDDDLHGRNSIVQRRGGVKR